jgi:hypothetical protein
MLSRSENREEVVCKEGVEEASANKPASSSDCEEKSVSTSNPKKKIGKESQNLFHL